MQIRLYVCPTEGCPDYVGYGGMPDLTTKIAGDLGQNFERRPRDKHRTRADCPTCYAQGRGRIQRVLVQLDIPRPSLVELAALPAPR